MAKLRIPPPIEPSKTPANGADRCCGGDDPDSYRLGSREYDWHSHVRGQLFCVESGLVHVRTSHGSWLLPPQRGLDSAGERHWAGVSGAASGWSVIVAPAACAALPAPLRDRHQRADAGAGAPGRDVDRPARTGAARGRVADVLLDEIQRAPREPLHLPMPSDPRLARIARAVYERPDDPRLLEDWARWGAVSPRTLRRLMAVETGMSFGRWRQQAGLIHALERLAQGEAVATVADALGYASPSGFIAMFRRAFGASPGRYFAQRQE